jgi:anti-sigma regulatory factor (Ser/Thr protein kinase)
MSDSFQLTVSGGVDAPSAARRAIAEHHPALPQPEQDDILLLVTELVTNAVRHGGAASQHVQVEVWSGGGRIRVNVVDPGLDFDAPARPRNGDSNGGWGLFLVDKIAESWGVCPAPAGTCVWFEVPAGVTA